ncbi:PREDICTED: protease Do-like 10, mitochondrial [Nicotiana attenuata]|uniref:Protease do-like 10, mitochondrial n=1 Tax=Nicotiana attenuata TaxID=49451 RepID=A0A314L588_NICAT|nr:PREDICTED: protease Do-like 10, mitochondrial [Nicotiana attenuata]OIT36713.1 protease do-like 10, mitochondrial [Nicotiana attenuata]
MLRIGSTLRTTRKLLNRNLHFQYPIIAGDVAPVHHRRQELHRFVRCCNYSSTVDNTSVSTSFFPTLSNSNSSTTSAEPHAERAEENDSLQSDVSEVEPVAAVEQRLSSGMEDAYLAIELALDSVVKIFTVSSSPNYFLPWQNKSQRETTGSGFVIRGKRILTNAHVVADHTFVLVRKHGSPTKYRATVQAVGHECDLAILVVESEEFWEGMNSLELGDVPFLQEAVAVVGYPQGGDNISVTKGVVSRVEPTQYVHGASQLLAIQIDAAINPGNSGGPAIMGDKVAGVAFQNLSGAENIGYIIPVPVIKHFIAGVEERGEYVGFCSLGLSCQPTENAQIREYFQMQSKLTGVLVSRINPLSDASRVLKKDDIILSFDGVPVANDGTVPFRNRERITFDHLVSMKKPNETAELKVLRNGEVHDFKITLHPLQPLVPVHQFDKLPSYFIFAGLVFIPLTQPFLHEYGEDWYNASPRRLCERALRELPKKPGEQFIILSQVLMDDINAGYERLAELQVKKVNGVEVLNLKHLRQLVEDGNQKNVRFDLDDERVIVLNYESARIATSRILKRHRIPHAMSSDLTHDENAAELQSACSS